MRALIDFYFKGGDKQFIAVTKFVPTQTDEKEKTSLRQHLMQFPETSR